MHIKKEFKKCSRVQEYLFDENVKPTKGKWCPVKSEFVVGGFVSCKDKEVYARWYLFKNK